MVDYSKLFSLDKNPRKETKPVVGSPSENQTLRQQQLPPEEISAQLSASAAGTLPNELDKSLPFSQASEAAKAASTPFQPQKRGNEETRKGGNEDVRNRGSEEVRNHTNEETRKRGIAVPRYQFDLAEIPDEKYGFVFTVDELDALEDVKRDAKRKFGVKTSKQELVRCAVQHLIESFYASGEASDAIKRIHRSRQEEKIS